MEMTRSSRAYYPLRGLRRVRSIRGSSLALFVYFVILARAREGYRQDGKGH